MSPRSRSIAALAVALLVGIRLVAVAQKPDVLEVFVSGVKHAPFPTVQGDHRRDFAFASIRGGWMKARGSSSLMGARNKGTAASTRYGNLARGVTFPT